MSDNFILHTGQAWPLRGHLVSSKLPQQVEAAVNPFLRPANGGAGHRAG